jgi:hypothetical protein
MHPLSIKEHLSYREEAELLFGDLAYCFAHGPLLESMDVALEMGLNCQLLVHLVWDELFPAFSHLSKEWRSSELFAEKRALHWISLHQAQPGDVCFFGRAGWNPRPDAQDPVAQRLHLGVVIESDPDPWVIHASLYTQSRAQGCSNQPGGVVVERLSHIQRVPQYQQLFGLKRVVV